MNSGADITLTTGDATEVMRDAIRRAAADGGGEVICARLPRLDAYAALAAFDGDASLWHSPTDQQGIALGVAERLTARGTGRFHELAIAAKGVFDRYTTQDASPLRLYAGFAFTGSSPSERWRAFPAAEAVLPLVAAEETGHGAAVRVAVPVGCSSDQLDTIERALDALHAPAAASPATPRRPAIAPRDDFQSLVASLVDAIAAGTYRKVVAARRVDLPVGDEVTAHGIAAALREAYPDCHRFVFRRGDASFIGASPEALVRVDGSNVETVALAGSARSDAAGVEALQSSLKDASEHGMVVEHVRDALTPFCEQLDIAPEPRLRKLRDLVHLETPVTGQMDVPVNVLRLAAMMHPTPAVGGVPTARAVAWIAEHEHADRGWYAAPVGWFDASGHGELAVAIRSGLLRDGTISLWAGAGIVADSVPENEDRETMLKLEPLLRTLGHSE